MLSMEVNGATKHYHDILDPFFIDLFPKIKSHTITASGGADAPWALYQSIEHVVKNDIPGDIVECGVWNGGSILLAAMALKHFGDTSRKLYLYDTFDGMPRPADIDKSCFGYSALAAWENHEQAGLRWGFGGTMEMVRDVVVKSDYPPENFLFVKGMVEDTLPRIRPERISVLRLDTDLYQSTLHELVHLYPVLVSGGILIVDDYGSYDGARIATDQYMRDENLKIFLSRVDGSTRLAIKP